VAHRSTSTRDLLVEATLKRLWDTDESQLRIADLCRDTGLSTSVIYTHFGSRQGLVDAALLVMFERAAADYRHHLTQIGTSATSLADVLSAVSVGPGAERLDASMAELRRVRLRVATAAIARPALRERWAAIQEAHLERFTEMIAGLQREGLVSTRHSARQMAVLVEGFGIARELDAITERPEPVSFWLGLLERTLSPA
jgi:AcrR family transcriptional regulator